MPQSAAIQEKLRRFEPSISTPTDSSKPFGLFNSNEAADKQRKDLILGRSLIDENQVNIQYIWCCWYKIFLTFYDCRDSKVTVNEQKGKRSYVEFTFVIRL